MKPLITTAFTTSARITLNALATHLATPVPADKDTAVITASITSTNAPPTPVFTAIVRISSWAITVSVMTATQAGTVIEMSMTAMLGNYYFLPLLFQ